MNQLREVLHCLREHAVDRCGQSAQRRNRCQRQQNKQQRVFRQILAFFFSPRSLHQLQHSYLQAQRASPQANARRTGTSSFLEGIRVHEARSGVRPPHITANLDVFSSKRMGNHRPAVDSVTMSDTPDTCTNFPSVESGGSRRPPES